ncbi:MAG: response regulator [Candidatus Kapabacteria bacterium]|nr:response regulator [Candidatus Kapabacteria bacterium]
MRTLVIEDDFVTMTVNQEIMLSFGNCDVAEDGNIGLKLFEEALISGNGYDVVLLDIMMPGMIGLEVLPKLREIESNKGINGLDGAKIFMTTALDDFDNIKSAFKNQADSYLVKPLDKDKLIQLMVEFKFI